MSFTNQVVGQQYVGDGVTTTFAIPFAFISGGIASVLKVYNVDSATGAKTLLSTALYTYSPDAVNPTAIVFGIAPAAAQKIYLVRDTAIQQNTTYVATGPFPAKTHEKALDKITMIIQEVGALAARAIKTSVLDVAVSLELAAITGNALKPIRLNAAGTALEFFTQTFIWGTITGTLTDQTDLVAALALKAPLASPGFTGTPVAPTAAPGTNTTQLASTAFVAAAVSASSAASTLAGDVTGLSSANTVSFVGGVSAALTALGATAANAAVAAATAARIMIRDSSANVFVNNLISGFASTVTAAGTTVLSVASAPNQRFTGTTTQNVTLPNATTLTVGFQYTVLNRSTGIVTVNDNAVGLVSALTAASQATFTLLTNGTAAGTWDVSTSSGGGAATWGTIIGTLSTQTDLNTALGLKAPLASPTFTGVPLAPTAAASTNNTQLATTAYADAAVAAAGTSANTASTVMRRDANKNTLINNIIEGFATTVTAAGTTTLTVASAYAQQFTGTLAQTLVMPDATTLNVGQSFVVLNRSTGAVTVNANGGGLLGTVAAGGQATFTAATIGTAAGTWDVAASGSAIWGGITGTLASQTDLNTALGLKAPLASPTFTGTPAAPTPTANDNSTKLATTAYVDTAVALKSNIASPTFTGVPLAPTAAAGTSTTQLATTAFVQAAVSGTLATGTFTGTSVAPSATAKREQYTYTGGSQQTFTGFGTLAGLTDGYEITLVGSSDTNTLLIPETDATNGWLHGNQGDLELGRGMTVLYRYNANLGRMVLIDRN